MRELIRIFYGSQAAEIGAGTPSDNNSGATTNTGDVAATPTEGDTTESDPAGDQDNAMPVTSGDRKLIEGLLHGDPSGIMRLVAVEADEKSGRFTIKCSHPNRYVAAFIANVVGLAFMADVTRLATEQARSQIAQADEIVNGYEE